MEALGIFLGVDFCPYSIIPARVLPPPGSTCLFHSELKHMGGGGGGGGGLQTYFSSFSCGNFVVDKSCLLLIPVTWYPEYCPASGLACLFHGALEHMGGWRRGGGGHCGAIFLFSVEILSRTNPVSSSSCHLICGELPRLRVSMLVSQRFGAYRTYFFIFCGNFVVDKSCLLLRGEQDNNNNKIIII